MATEPEPPIERLPYLERRLDAIERRLGIVEIWKSEFRPFPPDVMAQMADCEESPPEPGNAT